MIEIIDGKKYIVWWKFEDRYCWWGGIPAENGKCGWCGYPISMHETSNRVISLIQEDTDLKRVSIK